MVEIKIDVSELKAEGGDVVKELAEFLKEKTNAEVKTLTNEIMVKSEEKSLPKQYLRVLLKKFLHKSELKDYYRIISGEGGALKVKGRKLPEE
ncbi:60S ribosomal protein L22 [Candidatus Bathyarchaeota archaeon]|nr:60S ribosomal protein L22 [Candidatus Bathyarchaeota archaeon]